MISPPVVDITRAPHPGAAESASPAQGLFATLLAPPAWSRLRALLDVLMLTLSCTAALLAAPSRPPTASPHLVTAVLFALVVLGLLYLRPSPDRRLSASLFDTCAYVLGVASLAAMLAIAADGLMGGSHSG